MIAALGLNLTRSGLRPHARTGHYAYIGISSSPGTLSHHYNRCPVGRASRCCRDAALLLQSARPRDVVAINVLKLDRRPTIIYNTA